MKIASSFLANPAVAMRKQEGGGFLLYNADLGTLTSINATGLTIWNYLKDSPRTIADIVAHLKCVRDNVPLEHAEPDVENFLIALMDRGYVGEVLDESSTIPFEDPMGYMAKNEVKNEEPCDPGHVDTKEGWQVGRDGRLYPYRGSSMKGTFKDADFVETGKCRPQNLRRGDVIVFSRSGTDGKTDLIVHRIVRIGNHGFITQGDNNRSPDIQPVSASQVVGKVIAYERSGIRRRVIGGWAGLMKAKAGFFFRMTRNRVYLTIRRLCPTHMTGRLLRVFSKSPVIIIRLSTKDGVLLKWVWRKRTIALQHRDQRFRRTSFLAHCISNNKDRKQRL